MSDTPFKIMGIINVTPDSFSDGGLYDDRQAAIEHGWRLIEEGADILDIGGESTRPGADPITEQQEIDRVVPVIEGLKDAPAIISIDTYHAATIKAALEAGAGMVNDVTALSGDSGSLEAAQGAGRICLMHMQGTPRTMQENPQYDDVVQDVFNYLAERIQICTDNGISKDKLIADPGIGFGKTLEQNLVLLKNLGKFHELGTEILLGVSRKRFIGAISGEQQADKRIAGSLAAVSWGLSSGVQYYRVHDVAETRQALRVYQAILDS